MRQQPMIADIDPEHAEDEKPEKAEHQPAPAEKPGGEGQQRKDMENDEKSGVAPIDCPL
jgi:hypothetical protein